MQPVGRIFDLTFCLTNVFNKEKGAGKKITSGNLADDFYCSSLSDKTSDNIKRFVERYESAIPGLRIRVKEDNSSLLCYRGQEINADLFLGFRAGENFTVERELKVRELRLSGIDVKEELDSPEELKNILDSMCNIDLFLSKHKDLKLVKSEATDSKYGIRMTMQKEDKEMRYLATPFNVLKIIDKPQISATQEEDCEITSCRFPLLQSHAIPDWLFDEENKIIIYQRHDVSRGKLGKLSFSKDGRKLLDEDWNYKYSHRVIYSGVGKAEKYDKEGKLTDCQNTNLKPTNLANHDEPIKLPDEYFKVKIIDSFGRVILENYIAENHKFGQHIVTKDYVNDRVSDTVYFEGQKQFRTIYKNVNGKVIFEDKYNKKGEPLTRTTFYYKGGLVEKDGLITDLFSLSGTSVISPFVLRTLVEELNSKERFEIYENLYYESLMKHNDPSILREVRQHGKNLYGVAEKQTKLEKDYGIIINTEPSPPVGFTLKLILIKDLDTALTKLEKQLNKFPHLKGRNLVFDMFDLLEPIAPVPVPPVS